MSFKSFRFLEEYNRRIIKEADELEDDEDQNTDSEESSEESSEGGKEEPEENPEAPQVVEGDPEVTADVDEAVFISDIKKAEWAKLMLDALMTPKPDDTADLDEYIRAITTENSDAAIRAIRNKIKIGQNDVNLERALSNTI